jgi:hypothetical protein
MDMNTISATLVTGIVATLLTDLWALARRRLFGIPLPNYGFVGRWIAHMPRGRFRHESIAAATPARGEGIVGWSAHYLIGIAFAFLLPQQPALAPALLVGIATVAAPFFIMQYRRRPRAAAQHRAAAEPRHPRNLRPRPLCRSARHGRVRMIPISQKKQMNCAKKNPNRQDATAFVWTKHTCTIDWRIRVTRMITDSPSTRPPVTCPT